jgi:integrase
MVAHLHQLPETKKTRRDIALVLVAFFGAFRRQELVSLQAADLQWEPEGLLIQLPRSKTDQTGKGLWRALPFGMAAVCPGTALRAWLEVADISEGPLFRPINRWDVVQPKALHPSAVNGVLKRLGTACGFDFVADLSSHSFRRGLSTSAARAQVPFELIKKQGGWKSDAVVWEYIEEGQPWAENAAATLMGKLATLVGNS